MYRVCGVILYIRSSELTGYIKPKSHKDKYHAKLNYTFRTRYIRRFRIPGHYPFC